jgi:hypothetical protein
MAPSGAEISSTVRIGWPSGCPVALSRPASSCGIPVIIRCAAIHLVAGTHADNMHDMALASRRRSNVLTSDQRAAAVAWYGRGLATAPEIARLLGVTPQRIRHLFHGT